MNTLSDSIQFGNHPCHVLVSGATGFVGQALVTQLLKQGHQISILTRNTTQAKLIFGEKVRYLENMSELNPQENIEVMINLAGARILGWRWTKARKETLLKSRIGTTTQLIDWIAKAQTKPKLLLSASAIGYYGIQTQGDQKKLSETESPQTIFMSTLCQEWENAAKKACGFGVQVRCTRFGLILGKSGALPMMLLPIKLGLGGRLGSGKQWLSWIHIDDALRGIAHIWAITINQHILKSQDMQNTHYFCAYNFTAPEAISQKEFAKTAASIYHRPCFFPTPNFLMRLTLGEQADLLLEGQRVAPTRLIQESFEFKYSNLKEALTSLKHQK